MIIIVIIVIINNIDMSLSLLSPSNSRMIHGPWTKIREVYVNEYLGVGDTVSIHDINRFFDSVSFLFILRVPKCFGPTSRIGCSLKLSLLRPGIPVNQQS